MTASSTTTTTTTKDRVRRDVPRATLLSLPPELHAMVTSHLTYPDLLSLKLTNTYFWRTIGCRLTVHARVDWIQSRCAGCLPVPRSSKLCFVSDASFVANKEIKTILRRRRRHLECVDLRWCRLVLARRKGVFTSDICLVTEQPACEFVVEAEKARLRFEKSLTGRISRAVDPRRIWQRVFPPNPLVRAAIVHNAGVWCLRVVVALLFVMSLSTIFVGQLWVVVGNFVATVRDDWFGDVGILDLEA